MFRRRLTNLAFNVAFWTTLFTLVFAIRYFGIATIEALNTETVLNPARIYGNGLLLGVLVAIPYSLMESLLETRGLYEASLAAIMVRRTLIQFVIASAVLIVVAYANYRLVGRQALPFSTYLFSPTALFLFISALVGNGVLTVFRTLQMKIGQAVFFDLLRGTFRPAKEQDRAFLFLDLNSSTEIAETLGHERYSFFIQDCFQDLHAAVTASNAHVYQYVGDEAVLTWPTEEALRDNNCLEAFFAFERQLAARSRHYRERYGILPVFKGGLNAGPVMAAEVGVVRREIAYHGDVLNTAARIQHKCSEIGARLLASESVVERLTDRTGYALEDRGEVVLRGKQRQARIFEVKEAS